MGNAGACASALSQQVMLQRLARCLRLGDYRGRARYEVLQILLAVGQFLFRRDGCALEVWNVSFGQKIGQASCLATDQY